METRQPDETRKVGEEAVGALTRLLSSPTRNRRSRVRGWMWLLFIFLIGLTGNGRAFIPSLTKKFGGQPEIWLVVAGVACWVVYSLIFRVILLLRSRNSEFIVLRRSASFHSPRSHSAHPAIWTKFFERYMLPALALILTLFFVVECVRSSNNNDRLIFLLFATYGAYITAFSAQTLLYPLLLISDSHLQVQRHKIPWAQLNHVQIGSDRQGSPGVWWKFFDAQGRLLAKTWISDDLQEEQKQSVAELAQVLDAKVEEKPFYVAPRRVGDDSLNPVERPY